MFRKLFSLGLVAMAFLLTGSVAGCSMLPYGPQVEAITHQAEVTAVKDRRNFNDDKAELTAIALCDMSVGAFYRIANPAVQYGTIAICSGKLPNDNLNLKPVDASQPTFGSAPAPTAPVTAPAAAAPQ